MKSTKGKPTSFNEKMKKVITNVNELSQMNFVVGVNQHLPQKSLSDKEKEVIAIANIVNYGTDRIPTRDFHGLAVRKINGGYVKKFKAIMGQVTIGGQPNIVKKQLDQASREIREWLTMHYKNAITEGTYKPLAPSTIRGRVARGNTSTKPLVDTGRMLKAVGSRRVKDLKNV
jgi:hypothetical protein